MAAKSSQQSEARTLGFLIMSSLFHTALAIGVFAISVEAKKIIEVTEVEFLDSKSDLAPVTTAPDIAKENVAPVEEVVAAAPVVEQAPATPAPAPVVKAAPAPPQIAKALPVAAAKPKAAPSNPEATQAISPVVVPVLETADLAEPVSENEAPAELSDEDIAGDLDKVDQEHAEKAVALQNELEKETEKDIQDQNAKLAALQTETEQESAALASENAQKRADEKAALAAATAARIAAEAEAEKIASASGTENGTGKGTGEIRALEDLKQISGNKRPAYDADDRLKGRQGEVAFLAYVAKNGGIAEFKLIKSSGHRQLDAKTLKALRDWKFQPGQEGWVEIPFKWDLKGGPQEMPATLRRAKVSSQN